MTKKLTWLVALSILPLRLTAQAPSVITMNQEPHHHLVLHNSYVNIFDAKTAAGESLQLHRHDHDAIAIAIGDQTVTVGVPGKPDVPSKNADGQVRMQRAGYIHSTRVDGDAPYFTVAVELLRPQTGSHNLCAAVLAGEPLKCPDSVAGLSAEEPQFESDQTHIGVRRVGPGQKVTFGHSSDFQLIVALDPSAISPTSGKEPRNLLNPGDFVWFDKGGPERTLWNAGDKIVRVVLMTFKP